MLYVLAGNEYNRSQYNRIGKELMCVLSWESMQFHREFFSQRQVLLKKTLLRFGMIMVEVLERISFQEFVYFTRKLVYFFGNFCCKTAQ